MLREHQALKEEVWFAPISIFKDFRIGQRLRLCKMETEAEIAQKHPFLTLSKGTQRIALPQSRYFAIKSDHAMLEDYK